MSYNLQGKNNEKASNSFCVVDDYPGNRNSKISSTFDSIKNSY